MSIPRVSAADVGTYWLGGDGKVWQVITYCEYPTVSFARVDDPSIRRGGAVGSLITDGFVRLVSAHEGADKPEGSGV